MKIVLDGDNWKIYCLGWIQEQPFLQTEPFIQPVDVGNQLIELTFNNPENFPIAV